MSSFSCPGTRLIRAHANVIICTYSAFCRFWYYFSAYSHRKNILRELVLLSDRNSQSWMVFSLFEMIYHHSEAGRFIRERQRHTFYYCSVWWYTEKLVQLMQDLLFNVFFSFIDVLSLSVPRFSFIFLLMYLIKKKKEEKKLSFNSNLFVGTRAGQFQHSILKWIY